MAKGSIPVSTVISLDEPVQGEVRVFCSVQEPNTRFQVAVGAEEDNKPVMTMDGPIYPLTRVGDKFAEFQDGLCATDDPDIIAFCTHPKNADIIFDVQDPATDGLVRFARLMVPRSNYEPESSADLLSMHRESVDAAIEAAVERKVAERLAAAVAEAEATT